MGLTIQYKLAAEDHVPSEVVRELFETAADYARHLQCANVGQVIPARELADITTRTHLAGRKKYPRRVPLLPEDGWMLTIDIGDGCQPLILGLCRYPRRWRCQHGSMWRWYPTKFDCRWEFGWFCKTQFAGQHGAAHFLRCHKLVIGLLDFCRKAGLEVSVTDETGFWEKRDEADLRETLHRNESLLAAFGGVLKETVEDIGDRIIESPIFDYTNFEHLEHEGWQKYGQLLAPLHPDKRSRR